MDNVYTDYVCLDKELKNIKYTTIKRRQKDNATDSYKEVTYLDNLCSCDIETTSGFLYNSEMENILYNDYLNNMCVNPSFNKIYKHYEIQPFIHDTTLNDLFHEKYSVCYFWSACIEDDIINRFYGRTLESFKKFVDELMELLPDIYIIFYIHNASFEFQFFRNIFDNMRVFARKTRKPIYFTWENLIFRCSYMLTRLSLAKWAKVKKLPHQKLIGDLDYIKIRTPYSNMKPTEIDYGVVDSIIVIEGLHEYKEQYKHVYAIPLTQTGVVRKEVNSLLAKETKLHKKNRDNFPDTLPYYQQLVSIFGGGLTIANYIWVDKVLKDLRSRDSTSAYPWQMESQLYPSTRFMETTEIGKYIDNPYCLYYIEVEYFDIKSLYWLNYISISKCIKTVGAVCVNGRVQSADYLKIRVCDVDYKIISRSYTSKRKKILSFKYAIGAPLNNTFRKYLLTLFNNKCTLDGINPDLYAKSKEYFNGMYGNIVTKELVDMVLYEENKWSIKKLTPELFDSKVEKILEKMYKLNFSYAQGVWVPAYQRQAQWSFVYDLDSYIAYMDTDCHKYFWDDYTENVFEKYNKQVRIRQEEVAKELDVSIDLFRPITPKGVQKSLGEYTIETEYKEFKTLGAKRYAYKDNNDTIHITVSGVNKEKGATQLKNLEEFKDGYIFDYEHSGSLTITYLDNQPPICYNKGKYDEFTCFYRYGITSEPSTYTTSLKKEYRELLAEVKGTQTRLIMENK